MRFINKWYVLCSLICIVLLAGSGLAYVYLSKPLIVNGYSALTHSSGKQEIVYSLVNKSKTGIKIHEVKLGGKLHDEAMVGISFDTGQLVQSGTQNPGIQFFPLNQAVIRPALSTEEVFVAMSKKEMTPIHYGVRVECNNEEMKTLTFTYSYYGLKVTRQLHWPPSG
ncbi:hypothetical protein [Paenibacillus pinihumi]|uniref:hypothetical protein n=1 Tax=Paenibacillus pinihumi TaxID=669462 RepID=UPI0004067498|nr:hypothetical protein [Paenibacillus pinihumi]